MVGQGEGTADKGPRKKSDLLLRVISAAVLVPVTLAVAWAGGLVFGLLALVVAMLFLREWFLITGTRSVSVPAIAGFVALAACAVAYYSEYPALSLAAPFVGALCVYGLGGLSRAGRWAGEGVVYGGLALYALLAIREGANGRTFLLYLFAVVWATDILAYFVGRAVGGPKLWRRISPNKTWSGAVGGFVFAVAFGTGTVALLGQTQLGAWAVLAGVLSIASQLGDLLESGVKRRFNVKDSSHLIPGHGGIMDRVDGLVAAAILSVALGLVFGGNAGDPISGLALG